MNRVRKRGQNLYLHVRKKKREVVQITVVVAAAGAAERIRQGVVGTAFDKLDIVMQP
jgi:hypothetical protein